MPKVTPNQIVGNRGENLAGYLLSQFCLIRQVASGTDVGIDLYCESITDEQPNNHFWVQVKSSLEEQRSVSLEKELLYWWRQPIPVFIFLVQVSGGHATKTHSNVNVVNLTEHFLTDSNIEMNSRTFKVDLTIDSPFRVFRGLWKLGYALLPWPLKISEGRFSEC